MNFIMAMLIALLNTLLNHTMLTTKRSLSYCAGAFFINSAVVIAALIVAKGLVADIQIFKYLFSLIMFLYIGYIHLVFQETLSKKIFVMFSTWVISAIIFHMAILIAKLFFDPGSATEAIAGFRICFQLIMLWILTKPWFRNNYRRILALVQDSIINLMSVYMIIAYLLLLNNMTNVDYSLRNFATVYDLLLFILFIILGYVIVFTGIASSSKTALLLQTVEMTEKKSELHYKMANIDSLTGVASRLNILNRITEAIQTHARDSQRFAVLMLDIDKFKLINDNYGHTAGDEALKYLADQIGGCLRDNDAIGRVGGDEFVILIRQIHGETDLEHMIGRIFKALNAPLVTKSQQIPLHISIGICLYPENAQSADELVSLADRAMYQAKKTEGNSYSFAMPPASGLD